MIFKYPGKKYFPKGIYLKYKNRQIWNFNCLINLIRIILILIIVTIQTNGIDFNIYLILTILSTVFCKIIYI